MHMPILTTERLLIRPFVLGDLEAAYRILDIELGQADTGTAGAQTREQRRAWLEWSVLNYEQLAWMYQPPYGDRAVVLKRSGELIGAAGYVPALGPFDRLPGFSSAVPPDRARRFVPAFGLYWAITPAHQRQGYAGEAARALIDYAFTQLKLQRVIATTTYANAASIAVMRKAGMRIEHNPDAEPPWFQVVGIADSPSG